MIHLPFSHMCFIMVDTRYRVNEFINSEDNSHSLQMSTPKIVLNF